MHQHNSLSDSDAELFIFTPPYICQTDTNVCAYTDYCIIPQSVQPNSPFWRLVVPKYSKPRAIVGRHTQVASSLQGSTEEGEILGMPSPLMACQSALGSVLLTFLTLAQHPLNHLIGS